MTDYKEHITDYFTRLKNTIDNVSKDEINTLMNLLVDAREEGRQIFIMGNGGSASTASHYTGDFGKGISYNRDKRFKIHCLNDNVPIVLAYANDISYDIAFMEQLKSYMNAGDLVIGISGSGNSKSITNAIEWANENGGITVGLTGYEGGKLKQCARFGVHVAINDMQIVEDLHLILNHCMMQIIGYKCE